MAVILRRVFAALALYVVAAACPGAPALAEEVDLRLVLAADVSRSIDDGEFELQRKGYAQAFRDPRVLRAIRSGPLGRIAVCFLEWSGIEYQKVVADWIVIADDESAGLFADRLLAEPRPFANRTAIGAAIDYAVTQFERSGAESERRTVDVSGDGTNTNGRAPILARDDAVAKGIVINGLVIMSGAPTPWNPEHTHPPGGLDRYYQVNVVGGPGSFLMAIEGFDSFAQAITLKLIKEIAATPEAARALLAELPQ